MIVTSRRHRILGGLLLAALLALIVDMFAGAPASAPAKPAPVPEQPDAQAEMTGVLEQAQTLLDRLRAQKTTAADVPQHPPQTLRDLFHTNRAAWPHPQETTQAVTEIKPPASHGPAPIEPAPAPPPFTQRHKLRGIVCGPAPLALIDETIVSRGAAIDGYRVIEIRRDRVRLQGEGRLVTLVLSGPGKTAPTDEPVAAEQKEAGKTPAKVKSIFDLVDLLSGQ